MLRTLTATLALAAGSTLAGPLDPTHVIPNAAFVIHVDVAHAANGPIGRMVQDHKKAFDLKDLDEVRQFGVDPFKDILSVTVSAPASNTDAGVIVVETTGAVDKLIEHLKAESHAEPTNIDGREVFSFKDGDKSKHACISRQEKTDTRLIYLSENLESLVSLLKGGDAPKLPLPTPAAGSVISVQLVSLAGILEHAPAKDAGPLAMLSDVQSGWIDLGLHEERLFLKGSVRCAAESGAIDFRDMLRGFIAMGRRIGKGNEDLASISDLAAAVNVDTKGDEVRVDALWSLEDLTKAIEQMKRHDSDDEDNDEDADDADKEEPHDAPPAKDPHAEVIKKKSVPQ